VSPAPASSPGEAPREASSAPPRTESAPPPPSAGASTGTEGKYVVWSSSPAAAPRAGPDER
jgi:hypothetical protein